MDAHVSQEALIVAARFLLDCAVRQGHLGNAKLNHAVQYLVQLFVFDYGGLIEVRSVVKLLQHELVAY